MKISKLRRAQTLRVTSLAALATALILQSSLAIAIGGSVTPPTYSGMLPPSLSVEIEKTVQTPEIPPKPDIVFLADTTASMTDAIANVRNNATAVMASVAAATTDPQFGAAQYRDFGDTPVFNVDQNLTANHTAVQTAINTWSAGGGGDVQEAQLNALTQVATGAISFRPGSSRVVAWFGDASGHDPSGGATLASTITALLGEEIRVIAIDVNTGFGDGLDNTGQATAIATGTGGVFFPGASPDEVSDAILAGLHLLPITVTPVPVGCGPLIVTFDPSVATVTSGDQIVFDETITVPGASALAGQTVTCYVEFQSNSEAIATQEITIEIPLDIDLTPDTASNELSNDNEHTVDAYVSSMLVPLGLGGKTVDFIVTGTNGGPAVSDLTDSDGMASISYSVPVSCNSLGTDTITGCTDRADGDPDECDSVTKDWVDTILPDASCDEGVNPAGKKIPTAPAKGGKAQNPDGFYQLNATDNLVDDCPVLEILVQDGSGHVYDGPFAPGDYIKYTEDNDIAQAQEPGAGVISWHLWGHGDLSFTATDTSGNESIAAVCLVPPPPK